MRLYTRCHFVLQGTLSYYKVKSYYEVSCSITRCAGQVAKQMLQRVVPEEDPVMSWYLLRPPDRDVDDVLEVGLPRGQLLGVDVRVLEVREEGLDRGRRLQKEQKELEVM